MANLFDIFDKTTNRVIGDIDFSPVMIYLFDIVNSNALPFLASQFDVEGFKGMDLALTEIQKRELLKNVIKIKKHLGTPYAIKQALKAVGFENVAIQEGVSYHDQMFYDGIHNYDGAIMYGGYDWASFNVTISSVNSSAITNQTKELVRNLILYYKNARSHLIEVIYQEQ